MQSYYHSKNIFWGPDQWPYYIGESFSIFNVVGMYIIKQIVLMHSQSKVKTILILAQCSGVGEGGCKNCKWVQPAEVIMRSSNNCDTLQQPFSWVFTQHCFHGHLDSVNINWQRSKTKNVSIGGLQSNSIFHVFLLSSAYPRLLSIHWLNYWLPKMINLHSNR